MAYAALKTHEGEVGLLPAGLHGYGGAVTRPTTGWRPSYKIALGDFTDELNSIVGTAEQAFQSYENANAGPYGYPTYPAGSGPGTAVLPHSAAAGNISFGGNTGMILVVLGVAALALFSPGGRKRR